MLIIRWQECNYRAPALKSKMLKCLKEYGSGFPNENTIEREYKGKKINAKQGLLWNISHLWKKINCYYINSSVTNYTFIPPEKIKPEPKINSASLFGKPVIESEFVDNLIARRSQADFEIDFNKYTMNDNNFCARLNMLGETDYIMKADFERFMNELEQAVKLAPQKNAASLNSDFHTVKVEHLANSSHQTGLYLKSALNFNTIKVSSIKLPKNIKKLCIKLDRLGMAQKIRSFAR